MKAVVIDEQGDADVMHYRSIEMPTLKPGQVRIAMRACSLNYHDILTRRGMPAVRTPVGSQFWSAARRLIFLLPASNRPTADDIPDRSRESVSCSACAPRRISRAMRALLHFAMLFLRCVPAFLRSRNEQAIVELALRQQLVTYAQKQSRPRITRADRWRTFLRNHGQPTTGPADEY